MARTSLFGGKINGQDLTNFTSAVIYHNACNLQYLNFSPVINLRAYRATLLRAASLWRFCALKGEFAMGFFWMTRSCKPSENRAIVQPSPPPLPSPHSPPIRITFHGDSPILLWAICRASPTRNRRTSRPEGTG